MRQHIPPCPFHRRNTLGTLGTPATHRYFRRLLHHRRFDCSLGHPCRPQPTRRPPHKRPLRGILRVAYSTVLMATGSAEPVRSAMQTDHTLASHLRRRRPFERQIRQASALSSGGPRVGPRGQMTTVPKILDQTTCFARRGTRRRTPKKRTKGPAKAFLARSRCPHGPPPGCRPQGSSGCPSGIFSAFAIACGGGGDGGCAPTSCSGRPLRCLRTLWQNWR
jgi:hypothetical protein